MEGVAQCGVILIRYALSFATGGFSGGIYSGDRRALQHEPGVQGRITMSSHVMLTHQTRYRYDRPVCLGPQTIRLRPTRTARTPVRSYALQVEPGGCRQTWHQDSYGNQVAEVLFAERVTRFDITVQLEADLTPRNPFDFTLTPPARDWMPPAGPASTRLDDEASGVARQQPFYAPEEHGWLAPYCVPQPAGPHLRAFLTEWMEQAPTDTLEMLVALNRAVASRIGYQIRLEPGVWTPEETLARATGSCRDSAWLMIALLRHLGFAARFVSGYLIQSNRNAEGEDILTCDLHAWAEAFLPGAGWVGFDTTSGLLTAQGHLPLAATPAPEQAAPVTGLLDQCTATFDFSMQTDRVLLPDSI